MTDRETFSFRTSLFSELCRGSPGGLKGECGNLTAGKEEIGCPHFTECMAEIREIPMALGHDLLQEINEGPESNLPPTILQKMNSTKYLWVDFRLLLLPFAVRGNCLPPGPGGILRTMEQGVLSPCPGFLFA